MCWCELGMQFAPGKLLDRRSTPRRSTVHIKVPHIFARHCAGSASEIDSLLTSISPPGAVPGAEGEDFTLYIARWDFRLGLAKLFVLHAYLKIAQNDIKNLNKVYIQSAPILNIVS